jgi:hypothetical protein
MEPQVGLVSGRLEQKEYGYKPGSRVYAGPDWGWQTQESYQKTIEMRKGGAFFNWLSTTVGDPIKRAVAPVVQAVAPVVAPAAEAIGGILESTPIIGDTMRAAEVTKETLRQQAAQRGVDPRVVDVGAMAAEELVGGAVGRIGGMAKKVVGNLPMPPGPGLAPVMAGGAPMPVAPLQPSFERGGIVLKAVTARDPESLKLAGVKTGQDIVSIDEAKQLTKRSLKVQKHLDKIDSLEIKLIEALDLGADDYTIKRLRANLKKERPKLYSARSNVSVPTKEDPLYYGSAEARRERDALALSKGTTEALEEHHLFPKVVSAAFFGKMDELIKKGKAELDDLLLMNRVAIAKGRKPGDYKSGMYLLEKAPHNEYHTIMKEAGDEFKLNQAESWGKIVNEAKDVDDLLVLWRTTLEDLVVPTAQDIQSYDKLDALLKEVRSVP